MPSENRVSEVRTSQSEPEREQRDVELGLLEPGQPTEYQTELERRAWLGEFTDLERAKIRALLGVLEGSSDE